VEGVTLNRTVHYPRITNAILLVVLLLSLQLAIGIVLVLTRIDQLSVTLGITNLLAFGVVISIALKKTKTSIKSIIEFRKFSLLLSITIVITCVGLSIVLSEIDNLFRSLLPITDLWANLFGNLFDTDDIIGSFILLVIIAPLTEELLFRRVILDGFLRNYRTLVAIIVASILFGIMQSIFSPARRREPLVGILLR